MTAKEFIEHLNALIAEGKITHESQIFAKIKIINEWGWTDTEEIYLHPENINCVPAEDMNNSSLIIDATW